MNQPSEVGSTQVVTALHVSELPRVPDAVGLLDLLRGQGFAWLLDSAARDPRLGRFSFVGADPYLVVQAWGSEARLDCRRDVRGDLAPPHSLNPASTYQNTRYRNLNPRPKARLFLLSSIVT